jgi:hypothetical protein
MPKSPGKEYQVLFFFFFFFSFLINIVLWADTPQALMLVSILMTETKMTRDDTKALRMRAITLSTFASTTFPTMFASQSIRVGLPRCGGVCLSRNMYPLIGGQIFAWASGTRSKQSMAP